MKNHQDSSQRLSLAKQASKKDAYTYAQLAHLFFPANIIVYTQKACRTPAQIISFIPIIPLPRLLLGPHDVRLNAIAHWLRN